MTAKEHIRRGNDLAWMRNNPAAALVEYQEALALDPTLAIAHLCIGQIHFHAPAPRTEAAIAAFKEAVRCAPQWSEAHYWLGLGFAQKEWYQEAIDEHLKAISLSEKEDERLFLSLGRCYSEMERYEEAVKAYENGIRVARHENAEHYLILGDALHANRQLERACEQWRKVVSLRSGFGEDELSEHASAKIQTYCRS